MAPKKKGRGGRKGPTRAPMDGCTPAGQAQAHAEREAALQKALDVPQAAAAGPSMAAPAPAPAPGPSTTVNVKRALPDDDAAAAPGQPAPKAARTTKSKAKAGDTEAETRPARWKPKCPKSTLERVSRVMSQRMYCCDRERKNPTEEEFKVLGSTGNLYTVRINELPSCNCPDGLKGNHCKHIMFIFLKVLGVPQTSHTFYQKGLLQSELVSIFASAPRAPRDRQAEQMKAVLDEATGKAPAGSSKGKVPAVEGVVAKRLPGEDDDCPVCYETLPPGKEDGLIFCVGPGGCGNPLHQDCFNQWANSARTQHTELTCVYCRAKWPQTNGPAVASGSGVGRISEGYLNIGQEMGMNQQRDTSSYYQGPVRGEKFTSYTVSQRYGGGNYHY